MNSVKVIVNSHKVLSVKTLLLILFLSNDVKSSVLMNFFNVNFIDRISNSLSIVLINVDDNMKDRITFSYYHKNCDHFINHLLNLINLILKLSENIDILYE